MWFTHSSKRNTRKDSKAFYSKKVIIKKTIKTAAKMLPEDRSY